MENVEPFITKFGLGGSTVEPRARANEHVRFDHLQEWSGKILEDNGDEGTRESLKFQSPTEVEQNTSKQDDANYQNDQITLEQFGTSDENILAMSDSRRKGQAEIRDAEGPRTEQATVQDQNAHDPKATSDNHAADTHDDRVGRRHVDCSDCRGRLDVEKEYWRPSYMFHWLKAKGWHVKDAYTAFEQYQGKVSYEQIGLEPPIPMMQDSDDGDEWSHMSDYDANSRLGDNNHQQTTQVWCAPGQGYRVQEWSRTQGTHAQRGMDIGRLTTTNGRARRRLQPEADDTEDEGMEVMCNMTGQTWESLPFPIIIDSGACASVMPTSWCNHVPVGEAPQSRAGEFYRAANGNKIHHEGERLVSMMAQEGSMRDMRFTACDVAKALGSVSQMCRTGHKVVFNPPWSEEGSYIEQEAIGERMWLQEEGGLYILKTTVAPAHKQTSVQRAADFTWPVTPP